MTEWNERVDEARRVVLAKYKAGKNYLTIINAMLDALKDPVPEVTRDPELPSPDMPIREPGKDQYGYQKED